MKINKVSDEMVAPAWAFGSKDLEAYAKKSQLSLYHFGHTYRARTELQGDNEFIKINKKDYLKLMYYRR